jgi:hypothetical protein
MAHSMLGGALAPGMVLPDEHCGDDADGGRPGSLPGTADAQAESAARFALRHNGQEPADRLLGATRALAAAITALVAELLAAVLGPTSYT